MPTLKLSELLEERKQLIEQLYWAYCWIVDEVGAEWPFQTPLHPAVQELVDKDAIDL